LVAAQTADVYAPVCERPLLLEMFPVNIDSYLERINYRGSRSPTADTLRELQVAHLRTVPFENLSISAGEPIALNSQALFEKIVTRRRGGFCYELNGLFAELLHALGFQVQMLAAQVARPDGTYGPKFDHMALKVSVDRPWLVDVGFGDSFLEPLLLDEIKPQVQNENAFRIVAAGSSYVVERSASGEEWKPQYRFGLEAHELAEYEPMCLYHQTSPDSHFTKNTICSRATRNGRVTLSGMHLITTSDKGERVERTINGAEPYAAVLRETFGIVM
jgi:N-hydroxyarylamine O-acetyltransferase